MSAYLTYLDADYFWKFIFLEKWVVYKLLKIFGKFVKTWRF